MISIQDQNHSKPLKNSRKALIQLLLIESCQMSSNEETTILIECDVTFDQMKDVLSTYDEDMLYTVALVANIKGERGIHVMPNSMHARFSKTEVKQIEKALKERNRV